MNYAKALEMSALCFPDRTAVIEDGKEFSYRQLNEEANRIASSLVTMSVQPGDHVAICAPNSYQWIAFYFGILKVGAVAVTLSSALGRDDLNLLLGDARPKVLFTTKEKLSDLDEGTAKAYLRSIVSEEAEFSFGGLLEKGTASFRAVDRVRTETGAILYTGGTTGTPKGVMLSHENMISSAHNISHFERTYKEDRAMCVLPLNHVFGQIHIMGSMIYAGGSLVVQPGFELDRVLDAVERHQATKFYGVPTIYIRLLKTQGIEKRLASLRYYFVSASSMPAELVRAWKSLTGYDVNEAYGMTETAAMVTYNHYFRHVVGSVGTPVNIVEVQVRDMEGNVVPDGSEGEICMKGPNMMKGYLNNPEETKAIFWEGGWLRSGDVGVFDKEGYLFVVDRIKDMVITGGENVYPREIEEVLYKWPGVEECAIIGLPDAEYGERVTACVVLKEKEKGLDEKGLKAFLKTSLASYKVPKEYILLDELPKAPTGKPLKRELRKQCQKMVKDRK
jgi:long-chain acyl-CoA synthetase